MTQAGRLRLFQAFGVELEYMIVDRDSLNIRPLADELLKVELGDYGSDFDNGIVSWSNELVMHVIEVKSTKPESDFLALRDGFAENVSRINGILEQWNAMLMPTAAHPWMDPHLETRLWPHDNNEVYDAYNRIFDCRGHGWSNLQSTHLNLPFYDDEEFGRLHAAIRVVLPLLPALCASSPILDHQPTGLLNTRLKYYKTNQEAIPSITGHVIPEAVFSRKDYSRTIYEQIRQDIARHDPDNILDPIWVNSRGAIPRFDRGSVEIRIMDVQECPQADLAIQSLVIATIKALVEEKFAPLSTLMALPTETLATLLDETVRAGSKATFKSAEFNSIFGTAPTASAEQIWSSIYSQLNKWNPSALRDWNNEILLLLKEGPLARRMLTWLNGDHSAPNLHKLYQTLAGCLANNRMFSESN